MNTTPTPGPAARTETRAIASIALPLIGVYLAEFAMVVITKIVVGSLGHVPLAAAGLAEDLVMEILVVVMGMLSIVGVMVAERVGLRDSAGVTHHARQGFVIATLLAAPVALLIWKFGALLPLLGQDPEVVPLAAAYFKVLSSAVLPVFLFTALRYFATSIGAARVVLLVTLLSVALKLVLSYGLVFGRFGLPQIGVLGAAWATSLANWFMFLALAASTASGRRFAPYALWRWTGGIDVALCREILRLGLPVALIVLLEAGLFGAVQLLMGLFGAVVLATNQIVLSWVTCAFVISLGLAEATMLRVAESSGRGDLARARRTGLTGMVLAVGIMAMLASVPILYPELVIGLFVETDDPAQTEIRALAGTLFLIGGLFGVFDGLQATAARALRGIRDTLVPMWLAAVGYWVLGIGGGVLMAFPLGLGPKGLWWGLALGLMATGLALCARFVLLSRRATPT